MNRDRLVGVEFRQFRGIGRTLDDIAVPHQGHASLVLEINDLNRVEIVQQSEIVIETLIVRQERLVKAEMPFADTGRRVAVFLQQFGNRQFVQDECPIANPRDGPNISLPTRRG